jgi:2-phosphoglycerate kinase
MLYLIGGAPRAGKGTLALRLAREHGIPYFGLDLIRDIFHSGAPELGISYDQPILQQAPAMWQRISYAVCSLRDVAIDQVVEGAYLLPADLADCREFFGDKARMCWLGYADADAHEKFRAMREIPSETNDHTSWKDDAKLKAEIAEGIEFSRYLRHECAKYDLAYFDTSKDFDGQIEAARRYLLQPSGLSEPLPVRTAKPVIKPKF